MSKKKPTKAQITAWREARVANYTNTRSISSLARMVVELEDDGGCVPEFEIDDDWPAEVRKMKVP